MKLFMSGAKKEFSSKKIPPMMAKAKKILDSSKDGELFSSAQLSNLLDVGNTYLSHQAGEVSYLPEYSHRVGQRRYWGKPATIKQLIKESQDERQRRG